MRTSMFYLWGGAFLLTVILAGFLYTAYSPDQTELTRGIVFVAVTLIPAALGLVAAGVGFAAWMLDRRTLEHPHA